MRRPAASPTTAAPAGTTAASKRETTLEPYVFDRVPTNVAVLQRDGVRQA